MHRRLEIALSTVITLCAVTITVVVVREHLLRRPPTAEPIYLSDWEELLLGHGLTMGLRAAPVQLVEFVDFQCPVCRSFHAELQAVKAALGDRLAVTYYHFPLSIHPLAEDAARAAECARPHGRFEEMADALFLEQDEFGRKSWASYADLAGVPDTLAFNRCMEKEEIAASVSSQRSLGSDIGVTATPTLILNGWRLRGAVGADSLLALSRAFIEGGSPF